MRCLQNNVLLKSWERCLTTLKHLDFAYFFHFFLSGRSGRGTGGRFVSSLVGRLDWHQGWLAVPLSSGNLALSPLGRETGWQQPRRKYLGVTSHSPRASCALTSGASGKIRGQVSRPENRCIGSTRSRSLAVCPSVGGKRAGASQGCVDAGRLHLSCASTTPAAVGPRCRCKQRPSESGTWRSSSDSHSSSPSGRTVVQQQRPRQEVILEFSGPRFFEVRPRLGGLRLGGTLFSEATPGVA